MTVALTQGTRLNQRYVVKKAVADGANTWRVRDDQTPGRDFTLSEYEWPDAADIGDRKGLLAELTMAMRTFDHPGLVKVLDQFAEDRKEYLVTEAAEGASLETIRKMSIGGLRPVQVIPWALKIADALHYLHERPRPFLMSELSADRIVIRSDEQVVLADLNLSRLFRPVAGLFYGDSLPARAGDFVAFGKLLSALTQGEEGKAPPDTASDRALRQLIIRLQNMEVEPTFKDFSEVMRGLEDVLKAGDELPTPTREAPAAPGHGINLDYLAMPELAVPEALRPAVQWLVHLPVAWVGGGLLVIAVLFLMGFVRLANGKQFQRSVPAIYVVVGDNDLRTLDARTFSLLDDRVLQDCSIVDAHVIKNGKKLLLVDARHARILVLDTQTNQQNVDMSVDQEPQQSVIDADEQTLYCTHARTHTISVVSLNSMQMVGVFGLPWPATSVAISPNKSWLFASIGRQNKVSVLDPLNGQTATSVDVAGNPSAMFVSADSKELWVLCKDTQTISVLDASTPANGMPPLATVDLSGKGPIALQPSQDGLHVCVLCQTPGTIALVKVADHTLDGSVSTGGTQPVAWHFLPPPSTRVWIANVGTTNVTQVDLTGQHSPSTLNLPGAPTAVEFAP